MLRVPNGYLVETVADLPHIPKCKRLYLDHETNNDLKDEPSPFHGDRICGTAVTFDDCQDAWYIPVRMETGDNVPLEAYQNWLCDTLDSCDEWVNHNVKFDAHFSAADTAQFDCRLIDTLTGAKVLASDRFVYGLDHLSRDWLGNDISPLYQRVMGFLESLGRTRKSFARVPTDWMAEYAIGDVRTNRDLDHYIRNNLPEQSHQVWKTEMLLTPVLYDMELAGIRVDPMELKMKELEIIAQMLHYEAEIEKIVEFPVVPNRPADCYEVLVNRYGLPVVEWTDKGEPSFNKDALESYRLHPRVAGNPQLVKLLDLMKAHREAFTTLTYFVRPYSELNVNGIMHPTINQAVRTGRMSCKKPNGQQLNEAAKELVKPLDGHGIVEWDYSQVEFRLIVHYIRDPDAIKAYADNPDTDFHQWVADLCGVDRSPAKTINFCMAFGGGKKKVVQQLASNVKLVKDLVTNVEEQIALGKLNPAHKKAVVEQLCLERGEEVYSTYHERLPGLKQTTRSAALSLRARGYVYNAYGRRRQLPEKVEFKAFNSVIQSCAADLMKERTVAIAPRYNAWSRSVGLRPFMSVHDATVCYLPIEHCTPEVINEVRRILEDTAVKFRVPIRADAALSTESWGKMVKLSR